jgi:predicted N-acetyltransferase YhbS
MVVMGVGAVFIRVRVVIQLGDYIHYVSFGFTHAHPAVLNARWYANHSRTMLAQIKLIDGPVSR